MTRSILLISLVLSAILHAQETAAHGGPKVRFLAEPRLQDNGQVIMVAEKFRGTPFELSVNHLSAGQSAPG